MRTAYTRILAAWRRHVALAGLFAAVLACAGVAQGQESYRLGADDQIKVTVYQQPDLATTGRISARGYITFPLLGEVEVAGLSASQAENRIASLLRDGGFVRNPQVTVSVETFRSMQVSVLGEVQKPGRYAIEGETYLIDVLAMAGGLNDRAHDVITVVRQSASGVQRQRVDILELMAGDMKQNVEVADGDFVSVPKMQVFYIYGEVAKPGAYRLERNMTVMQALSVAGGLTPRATKSGIEVARKKDGKTGRPQSVDLEDSVIVDDVIYVKESLF